MENRKAVSAQLVPTPLESLWFGGLAAPRFVLKDLRGELPLAVSSLFFSFFGGGFSLIGHVWRSCVFLIARGGLCGGVAESHLAS